MATGVVEEKSSRVVELLLATIKPWQLLAGKIVGLGAVGLLQLVILSAIGAVAATAAGVLPLPTATAGMFAVVVLWYLLGFFLFAALYAAVAATVSGRRSWSAVLAPMIVLIIIPFVLTLNLLPGDPHNGLATVLSFVPFFSQTVMPARYALGVAPPVAGRGLGAARVRRRRRSSWGQPGGSTATRSCAPAPASRCGRRGDRALTGAAAAQLDARRRGVHSVNPAARASSGGRGTRPRPWSACSTGSSAGGKASSWRRP